MPAFSGLWDGQYLTPYSPLNTTVEKGNDLTGLSRLYARHTYGRAAMRELLIALIGAAAGQTASASHKRVQAEPQLNGVSSYGGKVTIQTFSDINRVTTAADITRTEAALAQQSTPATYPADRGGTGGGGKLNV